MRATTTPPRSPTSRKGGCARSCRCCVRRSRVALIEAANSAAGRTKDTYLRAQYLRVRRRRGHKKAIVAVAHSILVSAYHVLQDGVSYQELGGDYFLTREDRQRVAQRLVRQLERLGQTVTLEPMAVETG